MAAVLHLTDVGAEGGERFGAANVGDGDLCSAATQKQRRGETGFSQSHDQHFFAFEFHHSNRPERLYRFAPLYILHCQKAARGARLTKFECSKCK